MNAGGTCKTVAEVAEFARSAVAAIVVGSITAEPRAGNPGQVYYEGQGYSLNALGLPNAGMDYYRRHLPEMVKTATAAGKPLVASVAGFAAEEYATMARDAALAGVDLIELNLACPNVWDGGAQKRIACFDLGQTDAVVRQVAAAVGEAASVLGRRPPVGVKISPFSDPAALASLAELLAELSRLPGGPAFVTAVNTFPNAIAYGADGRSALDVGLAGFAGPSFKPIGLGQVQQIRSLLPDDVDLDVVGCGGVSSGADVADYLRAGACAVGVASAFFRRGSDPSVFGDLLADYAEQL
jgi:dihydroorotate dehydrogenase (fumarate)